MPWDAILSQGPTGLLALFVVLIFMGYLAPRWWVRERIKDKNDELERERKRNDVLMEGLKELLTYAEAADRILQAWYRRYEHREIVRSTDREDLK